jgi:hypothetical protein
MAVAIASVNLPSSACFSASSQSVKWWRSMWRFIAEDTDDLGHATFASCLREKFVLGKRQRYKSEAAELEIGCREKKNRTEDVVGR